MIMEHNPRDRARTAERVGGWAYVVVGGGHLATASLLPSSSDQLVIERQMEQARFPIPPGHSYADLMQGFSVAMAVLLVAWGVSMLLATRNGRALEQAQVALSLVVSLLLLGTSVLLLPAPPIVLMTVASVALAVSLHSSHRGKQARDRGSEPSHVS